MELSKIFYDIKRIKHKMLEADPNLGRGMAIQ